MQLRTKQQIALDDEGMDGGAWVELQTAIEQMDRGAIVEILHDKEQQPSETPEPPELEREVVSEVDIGESSVQSIECEDVHSDVAEQADESTGSGDESPSNDGLEFIEFDLS